MLDRPNGAEVFISGAWHKTNGKKSFIWDNFQWIVSTKPVYEVNSARPKKKINVVSSQTPDNDMEILTSEWLKNNAKYL